MDAVVVRLLCLIVVTACITFQTVSGNKQPKWVERSVQVLKDGIREDTKLDTFIGTLNCTDEDGDKIEYGKRKGNAIEVTRDGKMYLAVELDFEAKDTVGYDMEFTCSDLSSFGLPISTVRYEIELTVNDANDIAPKFTVEGDDGYSFTVSEEAQPDYQLVPQFQITDGDRTVNAQLSQLYIICNSKNATEVALLPETSIATCEKFSLNYTETAEGVYYANLSVKSTLDFETRRVYSSKLVAIDNPTDASKRLSTTINIQINIGDAQDVDPLFVNLGTTTVVSEGANKGDLISMVIAAKDGDIGDKRPVTITMVDDKKDAFTIDQAFEDPIGSGIYNARLRVKTPLDREDNFGNYKFTVKVTELDKVTNALTTATSTATYAVQVSDIDDQPPLFDQAIYRVNVTEMETVTTSVQLTNLRLSCFDRDETQNAQYKVSIIQQPYPDAYSISSEIFTGSAIFFLKVDNTKYIDYDIPQYREQTVVLEAKSINNNPLSSSTTIYISLVDINDNIPTFQQSSYDFSIEENIKSLPYTISTITAQDGDSGSNGEVRYRLEGGTSNKFEIDPISGVLSLIDKVDFEATPQYVFLIFAQDQSQDPQINQVQVTVEIKNLNDIRPEFEQSIYQTFVNEDKLDFLTPIDIVATDTEEGTGTISYEIIEGQTEDNAFNLNRTSGSLTLNQKLSYGTNGKYELKVQASDNGKPSPLTNTVQVTVNVIDQNNFPPVLNPKVYSKTLSELALPGTFVADVDGTDRDLGNFGKISYRISKGGFDNFEIDPSNGVVTVNNPQSFDVDQQKNYSVEIIGSDGGAPQLFDKAVINVKIEDANNKPPKFSESIYIATVDEKERVNFVIETVSATDPDETKDLVFSIQPGTIAARNGAGSLLTSTLNYNYKEAIGVNSKTGDVYIKNPLDKELALEISFIVQVHDIKNETANQFDTTRVTITITGDANTDIKFDRIEPAIVNEGSGVGYEITTVVARDPTPILGINNYQLVEESTFFEIKQLTGQIKLKKQVDYEVDPHEHDIVIKAVAADGVRSATATVNIRIIDDNDNLPVFEKPVYTADLDEDAPPLHLITTVYATDADTASYGDIGYRIGGGIDSENFVLHNSIRGVDVLLAKDAVLNYNDRDYYELDIIAVDNPNRLYSNVQKFTSVKLKITVIDKNNHAPVFLQDQDQRRVMAVAETAETGTVLGTIQASDDDFGENGEIVFSLRGDSAALQLFTIVPAAGIVTVKASSLIGYGGKIYQVNVFAQDKGIPYLSATKIVDIHILKTENNDGNPVWLRPLDSFIFTAPEETPNYVLRNNNDPNDNTAIFEVNARTGQNVQFTLSTLTSNYDSFLVDKDTGSVTIVGNLDREIKEYYTLLIYAEDTTDPTKIRTGHQINIQLLDKDDNSPSFTNNNYTVCNPVDRPQDLYFNENIKQSIAIYRVQACDPDLGSTIYYYEYNGNQECMEYNRASKFMVEEDGNIITKNYIDYEEGSLYTMCIIAQSTPNDRRKRAIDYATLDDHILVVNFHIRDENDNGPRFQKNHVVGVMLTTPGDYPVMVLTATDNDGVGFNVPIYTIIDSKFYAEGETTPTNPGTAFIMKNNELHSNQPRGYTFQEFAKGRFELLIQATDPVNPAFYHNQTVTVYVYLSTQAMRVTLEKRPVLGINNKDDIIRRLNEVSDHYSFHYLQTSVHKTKTGYDASKTDLCFIAVDSNQDVILDTFKYISLMGQARYATILNNNTFNIENVAKCYPTTSSEDRMKWKDLWWVLVVVAIFLGVFAIFCIVIIFAMHRRYRRYMETNKTYLVPQ